MLDPTIWGPPAWFFLHSITLNYPEYPTEADQTNFRRFFESLGPVLPCESCRDHYRQNLSEIPLTDRDLADRKSLIRWLIRIHNRVNRLTRKPVYTEEEFTADMKRRYQPSTCDRLVHSPRVYLLVFGLLLLLFGLLIRSNRIRL